MKDTAKCVITEDKVNSAIVIKTTMESLVGDF